MAPQGDRMYAKRSTRRLYRTMDKALDYLRVLHRIFDDGRHPKHAELLGLVAQMQIQTQCALAEFYRHTWGEEPGDWYKDVGS